MYEFMTRPMVAMVAFTYADIALEPGEEFMATPNDEPYLARTGKARTLHEKPAAPEEPAQAAPPRRGRPPRAASEPEPAAE